MGKERPSCSVSRHDPHNIEIRLDLTNNLAETIVKTEFFFYVPSSLKPDSWPLAALEKDFSFRLRLSVSDNSTNEETLESLFRTFEEELNRVRGTLEQKVAQELSLEAFIETTKRFGAFLGEKIKKTEGEHIRKLILIHAFGREKENRKREFHELESEIDALSYPITRLNQIFHEKDGKNLPYFGLLMDYVDYLFVQYLGRLFNEMKKYEHVPHPEKADFVLHWNSLASLLEKKALVLSQEKNRKSFSDFDEMRLLRISQLKKFFQSTLFVEVTRQEVLKRITEPVAAVAAGFAAIWATVFQMLSTSPTATVWGLQGVTFICLGIVAYILKDRIKDRGKQYLSNKISKYFPHQKMHLVANGQKIGIVKEWFGLYKKTEHPDEIKALREFFILSEAEKFLPEQLLIISREWDFHESELQRSNGLHETIRINFERYLRYMDDPYKSLTLIDELGHFSQNKTRRIYAVSCIIRIEEKFQTRTMLKTEEPLSESFYVSRIVFDKSGLLRVERLGEFERRDDVLLQSNSPLWSHEQPSLVPIAIPLKAKVKA